MNQVLQCRDLLTHAMSFLPMSHRLTQASLVSKEWKHCARAAGAWHTVTHRDWTRIKRSVENFPVLAPSLWIQLPTIMRRIRNIVVDADDLSIVLCLQALERLRVIGTAAPERLNMLLSDSHLPNLKHLNVTSLWWGLADVDHSHRFTATMSRLLSLTVVVMRQRSDVALVLAMCPILVELHMVIAVDDPSVFALPPSLNLRTLALVSSLSDDGAHTWRHQEFIDALAVACPNLDSLLDVSADALDNHLTNLRYGAFERLTSLTTASGFTSDKAAREAFPRSVRDLTLYNIDFAFFPHAVTTLPDINAFVLDTYINNADTNNVRSILQAMDGRLRTLSLCMELLPINTKDRMCDVIAASCPQLSELRLFFDDDTDLTEMNDVVRTVASGCFDLRKLHIATIGQLHDDTMFAIGEWCDRLTHFTVEHAVEPTVEANALPLVTKVGMMSVVRGCHALVELCLPLHELDDVCAALVEYCPRLGVICLPCHTNVPACVATTLPHVMTTYCMT
jgi:hypothetical protein